MFLIHWIFTHGRKPYYCTKTKRTLTLPEPYFLIGAMAMMAPNPIFSRGSGPPRTLVLKRRGDVYQSEVSIKCIERDRYTRKYCKEDLTISENPLFLVRPENHTFQISPQIP